MKIHVQVVTSAKAALVEKLDETKYRIKVNAKPIDGAANIRLIEILAEYFNVPFGAIRIVIGATSREKVIEIL